MTIYYNGDYDGYVDDYDYDNMDADNEMHNYCLFLRLLFHVRLISIVYFRSIRTDWTQYLSML